MVGWLGAGVGDVGGSSVVPAGAVSIALRSVGFGNAGLSVFGVSIGKIRPFGEAFFGVGHVSVNSVGSDTSLATGLGGGRDYRIFRPIAVRFEGDYLQTRFFGSTQNNVRFSTRIVFRF